jgi:hypothetical protein
LRQHAAHYRKLLSKAADPREAVRFREFSQLLDEQTKSWERHPTGSAGRPPYTGG